VWQVTPDCLKAKAEEAKAFAEKNMPKVKQKLFFTSSSFQ
jgi:hypothetical protein